MKRALAIAAVLAFFLGPFGWQVLTSLWPEQELTHPLPHALTLASYDLYWIVVAPATQRSGLGRRLLRATETAVVALGGRRLYAETSSRPLYAPTRGFYHGCGYREAALFADFYAPGDGKVVFERQLAG